MTKEKYPTYKQLEVLKEKLFYLHVGELRALAKKLSLLHTGTKKELITQLIHFFKTGKCLTRQPFPKVSLAKKGEFYPLEESTLILKRAYKNDLKTRNFFKKLIGPHFHFTAFGIDWLNERWKMGQPPTYGEFADMWRKETINRQHSKAPLKQEWAYLNFVQHYLEQFPNSSKKTIQEAWKIEREEQKKRLIEILVQNHLIPV